MNYLITQTKIIWRDQVIYKYGNKAIFCVNPERRIINFKNKIHKCTPCLWHYYDISFIKKYP